MYYIHKNFAFKFDLAQIIGTYGSDYIPSLKFTK